MCIRDRFHGRQHRAFPLSFHSFLQDVKARLSHAAGNITRVACSCSTPVSAPRRGRLPAARVAESKSRAPKTNYKRGRPWNLKFWIWLLNVPNLYFYVSGPTERGCLLSILKLTLEMILLLSELAAMFIDASWGLFCCYDHHWMDGMEFVNSSLHHIILTKVVKSKDNED